jgi:hypothetical protein
MMVTPKVLGLILRHEGLNQPGKVPPLDASGITIGFGYDLGQATGEQFTKDWRDVLPVGHFQRLRTVLGLRGALAKGAALGVRDIVIRKEDALTVLSRTLLRYEAMTLKAFPGLDTYPADVQGAVLSLVYNRGAGMGDPTNAFDGRQEMRDLRDAIARKAGLEELAAIFEGMAHLWQDTGADGLIARRFEEAALIREAA